LLNNGAGRAVGAVQWAHSTLWEERASRGRVAEWPVTDPILLGWYRAEITRRPS